MMELIKLARPKHWIKNVLILAPAFFATTFNSTSISALLLAFLSFSLVASAIYIINDISDRKQDALDPEKNSRPLASETVNVSSALWLSTVLTILALGFAFWISLEAILLIVLYFVLNLLYNWKVKHVSILDLIIVASGYLIRIYLGAIVVGIEVSNWMTILTFLFALFLAIGRRRQNLTNEAVMQARKSYLGYSAEYNFLIQVYLAAVITIAYIMYTISPDVVTRVSTEFLYVTSLPVIVGFLRYFQIGMVEGESTEPIKLITQDRVTIFAILAWLALFTYYLYF